MTEKTTWTREEVKNLIQPLMDQIEFSQERFLSAERELMEIYCLPWWKRIFNLRKRIWKYLRDSNDKSNASDTIIQKWVGFAKENPRMFEIYKEFYNNTRNN